LDSNYKFEMEAEAGDIFVNISEKIVQRFDVIFVSTQSVCHS